MDPFDAEGTWFRCALHAHTTNSDGELSPDFLVRHYEWAGYDVLAITDHWHRTVEASTRKLLVIPSTELNARCPTMHDDAHVLALGLQTDPELPEGEFAPLQEVVDWIVAERRPALPRPHLLERSAERALVGDRGSPRDRGVELRLRARARSRRRVAALGRGARARTPADRPRHRRLAPPRLRQRLRLDVGAGSRALAGGDPRRDRRRLLLRLDRPGDPRRRGLGRGGRRTLQPGGVGDALLGPLAGRAGKRRPARLPEQLRRCSSATRTAGSPPSAYAARTRRRTAGSKYSTGTDARHGRTRCGSRSGGRTARRTALRPARDRRRDHRSRHRRRRDRARPLGRTRRPRRLCGSNVERVVEAGPRRPALPPDGRRRAGPRGAHRAPRPDERRRPPPRPQAPVRLPAVSRRPPPAVGRADGRAALLRRSRGRASTAA